MKEKKNAEGNNQNGSTPSKMPVTPTPNYCKPNADKVEGRVEGGGKKTKIAGAPYKSQKKCRGSS